MTDTYEIAGVEYPVLGQVQSRKTGTVPLVDLRMMSDERWAELCREQAIRHYTAAFGHAPGSADEALQWEREDAEGEIRRIMEEPV